MVGSSSGARLRFAPPGNFAREVKRRGYATLAAGGDTRFADLKTWLLAGGFAVLGFCAYGILLAGAGNMGVATFCIVIAAFCSLMMIVHLGHDASHGALSPSNSVNRAVLFLSFAIVGVDGRMWGDRHVRLHHNVVNLPGTGIDADTQSLFRLMPYKPWRWYHRFQPLYGPLFFALGHMGQTWVEDFIMFGAARASGRKEFAAPGAAIAFIGTKLIHAALFLGLPTMLLQPSAAALIGGYFLASAIISLCFTTLVVGTHISDLAEFPDPGRDGCIAHDWATHQVVTSVDWAPASTLAVDLVGGANAHVAHHLFPGHSHRHLAVLSAVIAETAREHGIEHRVTTFGGMVAAQWRHIIALSRPQSSELVSAFAG